MQHQKDVATIAGGVTSVVVSAALGADPVAVSTWFFGAIDSMITRIQVGYSQNRNSAMSYLGRHARLNNASVVPQAGSLDVAGLRRRLEIVGPIGFKSAIAAGQDTDQAMRSMATNMGGVADEAVRNGDRDVITQTATRGRGVVGWRRRLSGRACGFCSMLASRGAVYVDRQTATVSRRGSAYHPHCHCWAEPLYQRQDEPPEVQLLQRQWSRVTAGHHGKDAQRVWRNHWEQRATPAGRARFSIPSPAAPGGPVPATAVPIRPALAQAPSPQAVAAVFRQEWRRLTGRDIDVQFAGSVQTAREHAEGLLLAAQRFPNVPVERVALGPWAAQNPSYARTLGREVSFSDRWTPVGARQQYVDALGRDASSRWHPVGTGNPAAIAIHEFGHVLDQDFLGSRIHDRVRQLVQARARRLNVEPAQVVDQVSRYAQRSPDEFIAEAFADVMMNGAGASRLSREVFDLLEAEYRLGRSAAARAGATFAGPARTVTQLRAAVADRGITVPAGLRKPDLVRLVDDLESGVTPARARETAVRTILTEREGVAAALSEAAEMAGAAGSARALQALGRQLRARLSADQAKTAAVLLRALDAGNLTEVRAALPVVARSAKVKPVGAAQDITRMDRDRMLTVGADDVPAGGAVRVLRPGFETTFEGRTVLLSRASVVRATPEQAARLTPVKAAKAVKAAPAKKAVAAAQDLTGSRGLSQVPVVREVQVENRIRQAYADAVASGARGYLNIPVTRPGSAVRLSEVRARLGDLDRAEVDAALRRLVGGPSNPRRPTGLGIDEAQWTLTDADRAAAIRFGGENANMLQLADTRLRPLPGVTVKAAPGKKAAAPVQDLTGSRGLSPVQAVREVQVENRIRQLHQQVATPNNPVLMAEIRAALPGVPDDELARIIARLGRETGVSTQNWEANALFGGSLRGLTEDAIQAAGLRVGNQIIHAVYFANPVLRPLPAVKAAKKAAAPKLPPTPDKMSIPALKAELQRTIDAAAPSVRFDLTGVPKSTLVTWTTRARAMAVPDAEEIGRWRQVVVDRHRHVAELLAEADELVANQAPAAGMGARARARLARIEKAIAGWPHEASVRAVVTAMSTGNPASIRRAIAAAQRKVGLEQVGPDAGRIGRFDRSTMSPISGGRIADDAAVVVVRPGYAVDVGGERVVLMRPTVQEATGRDIGLPSRDVPTLQEILRRRGQIKPGDQKALVALEDELWRAVDGQYGDLTARVQVARIGSLGEVTFRGEILDAKGNYVGRFDRTVAPDNSGTLVARHGYLSLHRRVQGSGFSEAFNDNLYDWYRRSGVAEVRLMANIDIGGYKWARDGYDFVDQAAAMKFLAEATKKIDRALSAFARTGRLPRGITEQELRRLAHYIDELRRGLRPARAPDIARFGRKSGQGGKTATWPGKWLMLGSSWRGVLRL